MCIFEWRPYVNMITDTLVKALARREYVENINYHSFSYKYTAFHTMLIHICLGSVKNIVDYPLLRVLSDSLLLGSFLSLSSFILLALSLLFFFSPLLVTSTQRIEQNSGKIFSSIYDLAIRKKAYPGNLKIYHCQSLLP